MSRSVDYYFSITSPWTYLGHGRFMALLSKHGAIVRVKPVDYGKIFPVSGGLPLKQRAPQRQAYRLVELGALARLSRGAAHGRAEILPGSRRRVGTGGHRRRHRERPGGRDAPRACADAGLLGVPDRNVSDPETVSAIVPEQDLDPAALGEVAVAADAQAKYELYTEEATARGVFGAPSYVVGDEIFWGQDRLDFVDRRLAR